MKIKAILEAINSKRDRNGNCYYFMRYTDIKSGKTVYGTISGGESNIYSVIRAKGLESKEVYFSTVELPIREFNREVKNMEYAGCRGEEIVNFIDKELSK